MGIRESIRTRLARCSLGTVIGVGAIIGVLFLVAGTALTSWTNTEEFCISCHEMKDTVYQEYKDTLHAKNRTGVRAICPDCHVPREPIPLYVRKMGAVHDLWGHFITGSINTQEKFEAKRHELATRVWKYMKENDSRECRHCHVESAMSEELQSDKAKTRHERAKKEKLTCVDCHFGITHHEPDGPGPQEIKMD